MEETLTKSDGNYQPIFEPRNSLSAEYGCSDLHMLAINNDVAGIRRAVLAGAQLGARTNDLQTPAMAAVEAKRIRSAALLYRLGEQADACDKFKRTALMIAAADGEVDLICLVVYYLRRQGKKAAINAQDWLGNTAMHWAAEEGCAFAIKCLRWLGARDDIKNGDGDTPMDLAKRYDHLNSIRELQRVTPVAPEIHHTEVQKLHLGRRDDISQRRRRRVNSARVATTHMVDASRPSVTPSAPLQVAA